MPMDKFCRRRNHFTLTQIILRIAFVFEYMYIQTQACTDTHTHADGCNHTHLSLLSIT